jgi:hypothetical protein
MKLSLYKRLAENKEIPDEELQKVKSRTLGDILLTLTHLSLTENIDVYEALSVAFKYRSVGHYANKYQT